MAINLKQGSPETEVNTLRVAASHPTTPASGDLVRFGERVGTALRDEDADGHTTALISRHIRTATVVGVDGSGNAAVAVGDLLYYVDADGQQLSKKTAGRLAAVALEAVSSGATGTGKQVLMLGW